MGASIKQLVLMTLLVNCFFPLGLQRHGLARGPALVRCWARYGCF